jgi:two-component system phosphate regulon response regulator PhoB
LNKNKILIIEDEPDIVTIILMCLKKYDFIYNVVDNKKKALEELDNFKPDIVLLDIMLNETMEGFEICKAIKFSKEYSHIPVIILSARGQKAEIEKGYKMKADMYITKPFDPYELSKTIISVLEKSKR